MLANRRIACIVIFTFFSMTTSGCSTIAVLAGENYKDYTGHDTEKEKVYAGTKIDLTFLSYIYSDRFNKEYMGLLIAMYPLIIIDLPLSFAADTIVLPYTIWHDSRPIYIDDDAF